MASHYEAPIRKPLVLGDKGYHEVSVDIAAPVEGRANKQWWIVFSIALAAIILREQLHKRFALWAVIAIVASYFLVFGFHAPVISREHNTVEAAMFALLAAFAFGSSTVFSKKILNKNTKLLFGYKSKKRRTRIMVTIPSMAAGDPKYVRRLLKAGMNSARINCAHDDAEVWKRI